MRYARLTISNPDGPKPEITPKICAYLFASERFVNTEMLPVENSKCEIHVNPHGEGSRSPHQVHS